MTREPRVIIGTNVLVSFFLLRGSIATERNELAANKAHQL
jgi:predicted nucleic acid-binding protein